MLVRLHLPEDAFDQMHPMPARGYLAANVFIFQPQLVDREHGQPVAVFVDGGCHD